MNDTNTGYSLSHKNTQHGKFYDRTYQEGYYKYQWEEIERPLLINILKGVSAEGKHSYMDFACGTGRITSVAEEYFEKSLAVDISEEMQKEARLKCKHTRFSVCDIVTDPPEEKVDVITSFRFFLNAEHALRKNILIALSKQLNQNGILITNIHINSKSILGTAYRLRNRIKGRTAANTLSYEEYEEYLHAAGFCVENVYWYSFLPRVGWKFPLLYKHALVPVDRFCSSIPVIPKQYAQSFLVVARKS